MGTPNPKARRSQDRRCLPDPFASIRCLRPPKGKATITIMPLQIQLIELLHLKLSGSLWVKNDRFAVSASCSLSPRKRPNCCVRESAARARPADWGVIPSPNCSGHDPVGGIGRRGFLGALGGAGAVAYETSPSLDNGGKQYPLPWSALGFG